MKAKHVSRFVAFCLLLALALTADAAGPLTGEQAIQHLKDSGQYESLAAAMTGARYGAKAAEGAEVKALAQNPAHGLRSTFTRAGLRLEVRNGETTHQSAWRLDSLGYGSAQIAVPAGELKVSGQRVEIARGDSLPLSNHKSQIVNPKLVEWFNNTPGGLEHGFTLAERPATNPRGEALRLVLAVTGDLAPEADAAGQNLLLRDAAGQTVLTYEKLKVWDATGAELPATMQVADGKVMLTVQEANAHYPLTIDPTFAQQAYLKASQVSGNDYFGYSVAVAGGTVVVGAPLESGSTTGVNGPVNEGAEAAGAAYVFVRSGTNWIQQAYLKASQVSVGDAFGWSVAVVGDTVVVGAPYESGSATGVNGSMNEDASSAGAAYVFVRSGTNWSQQAYLKASQVSAGDEFGSSVAVAGDTVVVGALYEDGSGTGVNGPLNELAFDAGAAYVFVRSGTTWSLQAYLKASQVSGNDYFGYSVAVADDTVVVGARSEDGSSTGVNGPVNEGADRAGAAYVFVRNGTTWSLQAYLKASQVSAGDDFGYSVAVTGDTVIVGAPSEDSSATGVNGTPDDVLGLNGNAGAAYVFVRSGTNWSQQAYLKASQVSAGDGFGNSVAVAGDAVVVGAIGEDGSGATGVNEGANGAGAAYAFVRSGTNWSQQAYLKTSQVSAGDAFGWSVAVAGGTVVVGAIGEDGSATGVNGSVNEDVSDAGAAYLFYLSDGDSDGDGLLDSWETEGGGLDINGDGIIDLDLYALGARPDHKDLFVEIDATTSDRPMRAAALDMVVTAFAKAPVQNPDNITGIHLHLELDDTNIPLPLGVTDPTGFPSKFKETKTHYFGTLAQRNPDALANPNRINILAAKARVYRYCLVQDFINFGELTDRAYNGIGEIGGNDFVINLSAQVHHDGFRDTDDQAATFMHELGHSLGLRHGGGVDEVIAFVPKSWHGKPNYPSLMNYVLTHPLKEKQNKLFWRLDYSREQLPDLNETSLNENAGIPSTLYRKFVMPYGVGPDFNRTLRLVRLNGSATDFNRDGTTDQGVSADLNYFGTNTVFAGVDRPSPEEIMKGHNDWANLQYAVIDDEREADRDISIAEGCPTMEMLNFLEANVPPDPDSFEGWVAGFPALGNQNGFSDDPDVDGISNGSERYFGTHPIESSAGLTLTTGSTIAGFQHTRSKSPGADAVASYEWSTNLTEWHPSGETVGGISVTLTAVVIATTATTETVAITPVSTGAPPVLFYRLRLQLLE